MNNISNLIKKTFISTKKVNKINSYDVIIHIGAPKTGSSAIQNFLLDSRKNLEKYAYFYPDHGKDINNISGGHSNLGLAVMNEEYDKAKMLYEDYLKEARSKDLTLLLSAESFYHYPEKLKKIISNEKVKIISFFRDPLESVFSNYNQSVKRHFQTNTIETFCNNILAQKDNSYLRKDVLNQWEEVYGVENVTVIKYDKTLFESIPIQEIFLTKIGMQDDRIHHLKPKKIEIINKSYSSAQLEFKRVVNHVLDQEDHKNNNTLDRYLQKFSDKDIYGHFPLALELPVNIISNLEENFKSKINITSSKVFSTQDRLKQILFLVEDLKKTEMEVFSYIEKCIEIYLASNNEIPYDVHMLSQWFDIYIPATNNSVQWFNQKQLDNMSEGKYKEADFLRDIATILMEKGEFVYAGKLISRALETRPNGLAIQNLKKKCNMLKALNNKSGRNAI